MCLDCRYTWLHLQILVAFDAVNDGIPQGLRGQNLYVREVLQRPKLDAIRRSGETGGKGAAMVIRDPDIRPKPVQHIPKCEILTAQFDFFLLSYKRIGHLLYGVQTGVFGIYGNRFIQKGDVPHQIDSVQAGR